MEGDRRKQVLQMLRPLTEQERAEALQEAEDRAVRLYGARPTFDDFVEAQITEEPKWFTYLIMTLLLVLLAAAANITVFRVYSAGRAHFMNTMAGAEEWQGVLVGVSNFLLAEFMVVISVTAAGVVFKDRPRLRLAMILPVLMGFAISIVGNIQMSNLGDTWGILETFAPPVAVLVMSLVGEQLIVMSIRQRHEARVHFDLASKEYDEQTAYPKSLPGYNQSVYGAIKDAITTANRRGRGATERREFMRALTTLEWSWLVRREMEAEADVQALIGALVNPTGPRVTGEQLARKPLLKLPNDSPESTSSPSRPL